MCKSNAVEVSSFNFAELTGRGVGFVAHFQLRLETFILDIHSVNGLGILTDTIATDEALQKRILYFCRIQ